VIVYPATSEAVYIALQQAHDADLVIKASGVGVFDELLEREVLRLQTSSRLVAFWDVDAPATLDRVIHNSADPFLVSIPQFDAIFTYGGGDPVVNAYRRLGARHCIPIYNGLDPTTHYPVAREERFAGDLGFLGNRLPDRERRAEEFFFAPAGKVPHKRFLLGGAGWADKSRSANIQYFDHVYTRDHNAFNASPRAVLNICRDSMAQYGFSPATRVFEAAGAAACLITDRWEGIEMFFEPGREILVASDGGEVADCVEHLSESRARAIGDAAYRRALAEHTYAHRAAQFDLALGLTAAETAGVLS
jgi:spore maturation protein CgeB